MSGVVHVKEYELVQKLESKKGLKCVVLEKPFVIITYAIGITKVEAASKTLNKMNKLNLERPGIDSDHWVPGRLYTHYPELK
jgi:hypothetical protein